MARHIGRHWPGSDNRIERECPCPQLACGLVDADYATEIRCPQHWFGAVKTIRDMHDAESCPAGLDEFLAAFNRDDNEWWRLSPGHQLNLFEEAVDRLAKLNDERLGLVGNLQAAHEYVAQLEERSTAVANDNHRLVGERQRLLQRIADQPERTPE